jgi:hypothetical protein
VLSAARRESPRFSKRGYNARLVAAGGNRWAVVPAGGSIEKSLRFFKRGYVTRSPGGTTSVSSGPCSFLALDRQAEEPAVNGAAFV